MTWGRTQFNGAARARVPTSPSIFTSQHKSSGVDSFTHYPCCYGASKTLKVNYLQMKKFNPADFSMALSRKLNVPTIAHWRHKQTHGGSGHRLTLCWIFQSVLSTYQHFVDWKLESASVANTYARRATAVLGSMLNTSHLS